MLDTLFANLQTMNLSNFPSGSGGWNSIWFWFFLLYLAMLCYLTVVVQGYVFEKDKKAENCSACHLWALWILAGFLLGYCALYTGVHATLCRGINTGLTMALLLLVSGRDQKGIKIVTTISLLAVVSIYAYFQLMVDERAGVAQYTQDIIAENEVLENIIDISERNTRWENTIACYGSFDPIYLALPAGSGCNYYTRSDEANRQAKYAVITRGDVNAKEYRQLLTDADHCVIYEDDWFYVMENLSIGEE